MDPANAREALREAQLDLEEGADMVMVKPAAALPRRDPPASRTRPARRSPPTTSRASTRCSRRPAQNGWIDERAAVLETLTAIRRAGADVVITYYAKEAAAWL